VIYVSGSHGFLGSHLVKRLPESIPIPRRAKAIGAPGDTVYMCAAYGNKFQQKDVAEMVRVNIPTEVNGKAVYVSSSSVLLDHQTPYSRTKRAAEEVLLALGGHCIVRPFSITGVGEQEEHLIPTLIRSCLHGEEMDFVPWPEHDYIDVEDVVDAMLNLSDREGVFEVGTGIGTTNQQVLDMVEQATGKKANVRIVSGLRPYDTGKWRASDFSARQFGWAPQKTLKQIVSDMVAAREADTGHLSPEGTFTYRVVPDGGVAH